MEKNKTKIVLMIAIIALVLTVVTATKGTNNISKYYYSIDNGSTFIESTSNSYTFSNLSRGNYNLHFYVEDLSGKKSNVYIKQYNIQSISKPIIIVWKLLLILAL